MSDSIDDRSAAHQTNVAGDWVERDKLTVTGDRNVVTVHNLVQGVHRLPTDYATRIENFLVEYLGTPDHPVPFGGREAALAALDAWLADPAAPPYMLLTAPAGRGKSALLTRWSQALAQREDAPAVVFLPVSVRFRTNLSSVVFASLAARLAHLHRDKVPITSESAEIWRGMVSSYLTRPLPDGRSLLVILDGVDEAADWDVGPALFALNPPEGLRVVVSARQTAERSTEEAWRQTLGWERPDLARTLDLTPLDHPGVAEVLERMGVPLNLLARDVDITGELYRLSEGDPLLVRLYVDDLGAKGEAASCLRPEDLRQIAPGLAGYFDRWWADQRTLWGNETPLKEPAVQALLNLLACALGPLTADDVLILAEDCGLTTWTLEEALRPLARFVVGDGRKQGYVFQHPRLSEYFYERLTFGERRAWEGRFLDWGQTMLEALSAKTLPPQEAPAYLVQYYGAHLERAHAPDAALYALVSEGWLRAWETVEGTYAGFLTDVMRAWSHAEASHHLTMQVKCALCQASVSSLSDNVNVTLLSQALSKEVLTPAQALSIVRRIPEARKRATALAKLAPHLSPELLSEALTAACMLQSERARAEALIGIAPHLPLNLSSEARAAIHDLSDEDVYSHALAGSVPHLSLDRLNETLNVARAFIKEDNRARVLIALLPHLRPEQRALVSAEALNAAQAIGDTRLRVSALSQLAPHLPSEQQTTVLGEALDVTRALEEPYERARALLELAPLLPSEQRTTVMAEALTATRAIRDAYFRSDALSELAPHLPPELLAKALNTARAFDNPAYRANVLSELAPHLSIELLPEALGIARSFKDRGWSAVSLATLAQHLPPEERSFILAEALAAARQIEDNRWRAYTLTGLSSQLPPEQRATLLSEALMASRVIADERQQAKLLACLASYVAPEQRAPIITEALTAFHAIINEWQRADVLRELAPHLPQEERATILTKTLADINAIQDKGIRIRTLSLLIPQLSEEQREAILTEALATVRAISDEDDRVLTLAELSPFLLIAQRDALLSKALAAACSIEVERGRAYVLESLIPHLPSALLDEVLDAIPMIEDEGYRAEVLRTLARHLSPELLPDVLTMVHTVVNEDDRVLVLASLASHLEPEQLDETLVTVRAIENADSRAYGLAELTPHLSSQQREANLSGILLAASTISNSWQRAEAFAHLSCYLVAWAERHLEQARRTAYAALHMLAARSRRDLLRDLRTLLPFFMALVAEEEREQMAIDIFHTIQDVCTWWP